MPDHPAGSASRRFAMSVACALAAAAVVVASGGRQTPPPQTPPAHTQARPEDQQRPTFRTDANLVRVDAFPTVDGAPVLDLGPDYFQVF